MPEVDIVIEHAAELLTLDNQTTVPRSCNDMSELSIIEDGAVAIKDGKFVAVGKTGDIKLDYKGVENIDASGKVVMPGFVDPHTHPVFVGSREFEYEQRIKGTSYMDIAKAGGGIMASVREVREADKDMLLSHLLTRLDGFLTCGTTTIEAKSGYGLSPNAEVMMLEVIKEADTMHSVDLVPTFLGAHVIPAEFEQNREFYINQLMNLMIPQVAEKNLAEFCDVWCEEGIFTMDESRRILQAAGEDGFQLKMHTDELSDFGGAELAAEMGCISADHLVEVSNRGLEAMREGDVMAVLLPGTCFNLNLDKYPPARQMIRMDIPVALATDFNPGSCCCENMQMIMSIACSQMRMTPAEAITAATINAAFAINRANRIGSIQVGKNADIIVLDAPSHQYIPYHFGVNLVEKVIKSGRLAISRSRKARADKRSTNLVRK